METTLKIDVSDYLSEDDIKELCRDQVRYEIGKFFRNEENAQRLLSNLSYQIVFDEIDKVIPNSREIVISKTTQVLNDIQNFSVFRDASYGSKPSLAYQIMEETVRDNKHLINEKVKETILNKDYSNEIWDKYEELAETFMSNIYELVKLGRNKSNPN